jgi:aspartate-semialdehyde dehydrogenase
MLPALLPVCAPLPPHCPQYAFNLFSHNSNMDAEIGYNEEELKMVKETKKIWGTQDVSITATCIRVPVMRAHAESINLEFDQDISEKDALDALAKFPGVSIIDDRCAAVWRGWW